MNIHKEMDEFVQKALAEFGCTHVSTVTTPASHRKVTFITPAGIQHIFVYSRSSDRAAKHNNRSKIKRLVEHGFIKAS